MPVWLHAYSHVNTLASAGAVYDITHDPRYLTILRNAHDFMTQTQVYATGGYGPCELTVPDDGTLGRALEWRNDTAEIVCGTWAVFKLGTKLLQETGEARYLRWAENLLVNGLGTVTPVRPDGVSPYYSDYRLGWARKLPYWEEWPCCSGTYVQVRGPHPGPDLPPGRRRHHGLAVHPVHGELPGRRPDNHPRAAHRPARGQRDRTADRR